MSNEAKIRGEVRDRTKPTPGGQGEQINVRINRFGELMGPHDRKQLSEQGSYFIAHNPINDAATTLAGHVAPVLADADDTMTKPLVFFRVPAGSSKLVYLDFIELDCVVIGASGTEDNWADELDTGATRWSSGGTALTIVNPNMQSAETSIFTGQTNHLLGGAVVSGAESGSVRYLGHGQISDTIMVAGDRYCFKFGGDPANLGTVDRHVINRPPVILGATDQYLLALYAPSQAVTAAVYKMRIGWYELQST